MKSDSIRLAWAGALIGVLALSAFAAAGSAPPRPSEDAAAVIATVPAASSRQEAGPPGGQAGDFEEEGGDAVPVMAQPTDRARFRVALRVEAPLPEERLFLCDRSGNPLEQIAPDRDGDAQLGPIPPGVYGIWRGSTELGSFRLLENAALAEAAGLLRSDGKLLFLPALRNTEPKNEN